MLRLLAQTFAWLLVGVAVLLALASGRAFSEVIETPAATVRR